MKSERSFEFVHRLLPFPSQVAVGALAATRGHPRLRMRHGRVPIGEKMRDAWLRCMKSALDDEGISGDVRGFLDARLAEVANFLRNQPE